MKYPQLVSTRAVNAISDWLVSRLEQLGVEAPQIYTRLLLSLLQSSVQINDPIEFSNLESFFASRKGGNKRYLSCDTDTLKKFNAVQCLKDIVSSEQEIATIENLVDELCVKLKDIEKQTADSGEDEDKLLVATLSLATTSTAPNHRCNLQHQHQHQHHNQHHHSHAGKQQHSAVYKHEQDQAARNGEHTSGVATESVDIETDPKKRYFRAFPALSKEMEDSFRIWRRNAKSLTWPVERSNLSISTSSSSSTISSSFGSAGNRSGARGGPTGDTKAEDEYAEAKDNEFANLKMSRDQKERAGGMAAAENLELSGNYRNIVTTAVAGVKRKSKRRRNQAMSKAKTIQNMRKTSTGHADGAEGLHTGGGGGVNRGGKSHRNASPSYWDTDFEGCWEMGRDLIKEFIVRQNKNSRNRSTSESATYHMREATMAVAVEGGASHEKATKVVHCEQKIDEHGDGKSAVVGKNSKLSSPLMPVVDISFCCDDDYDDTLASVSELTNDVPSLGAMGTAPRRLYERDVKVHCSRELLPNDESEDAMSSNEQADFEQFKAKFNSSVEALWKDAEAEATVADSINLFSLNTSSVQMPASLPVMAPFKEDLKNFWTKYYNHHFDLAKMPAQACVGNKKSDENCTCLTCVGSSAAAHGESANTSDYFSMPHNMEVFDRPVGGSRRDINNERDTPFVLFLQNSIWSDNSNAGNGDTDESFYFKVRNSAKRLNQLDVTHNMAKNVIGASRAVGSGVGGVGGGDVGNAKVNEGGFNFPPYNVSKWSEGINAGPSMHQQQQLRQQFDNSTASSAKSNNCNLLSLTTDCTDSSNTTSLSTTSSVSNHTHHSGAAAAAAYNWQTPINTQNLQVDLQSWSASNPISLTEMYGSSSSCSTGRSTKETGKCSTAPFGGAAKTPENLCMPNITLLNHSPASSGFIEYARIKSVVQIINQDSAKLQSSSNYAPQLRSKERYADDENLLTSERTHFHPIKSYVDGHTFDICSALDVIQYKRSSSGYLYLEEEKYLEYKRSDNCMAEDEGASGGMGASATPLYASSNCEAATARHQRNAAKARHESEFIIKFRLQSTEIACQTEDEIELLAASRPPGMQTPLQQQHPLCVIFSNAAKGVKQPATSLACTDAIEALNKAVAAAAKAAAAAHLPTDNHWLPTADFGGAVGDVYQRHRESLIWNTVQPAVAPMCTDDDQNEAQADCCDEVDFGDNNNVAKETSLEQQWSMSEIRKKCQLAGHVNNFNGSNNNGGEQCAGEVQSLWGMCAACNSELKSVPANRLLRDELKLEADEIMSDLKYMQDLYIGRADGSDSDTASESDWAAEELGDSGEHEDDGKDDVDERGASQTVLSDLEQSLRAIAAEKNKTNEADELCDELDGKEPIYQEPQTDAVIQKVNRLIAELLRPDNALIQNEIDDDVDNGARSDNLSEKKQFSGSLWHANTNERNIWQLGINEAISGSGGGNSTLKPLELLRHFNVEPADKEEKEDNFLSQLSWEHENLARIWQKATPPQQQQQQQQQQQAAELIETETSAVGEFPADAGGVTVTSELELADKIANKNKRNLKESWNSITGGSFPEFGAQPKVQSDVGASSAATATYKRVQQLLSNSNGSSNAAAKLKLANRKRRHSASQNYFHHASAVSSALINNNNDDIADLNHFNLKSHTAAAIAATCAVALDNAFADDMDLQSLLNASLRYGDNKKGVNANYKATAACDNDGGDGDGDGDGEGEGEEAFYGSENASANELGSQPKQTIITCKYHWTTIDAAAPMHGEGEGESADMLGCTALSCLIDKNASILKHVTMVTRPLTR